MDSKNNVNEILGPKLGENDPLWKVLVFSIIWAPFFTHYDLTMCVFIMSHTILEWIYSLQLPEWTQTPCLKLTQYMKVKCLQRDSHKQPLSSWANTQQLSLLQSLYNQLSRISKKILKEIYEKSCSYTYTQTYWWNKPSQRIFEKCFSLKGT